jgi:hypothetical protein
MRILLFQNEMTGPREEKRILENIAGVAWIGSTKKGFRKAQSFPLPGRPSPLKRLFKAASVVTLYHSAVKVRLNLSVVADLPRVHQLFHPVNQRFQMHRLDQINVTLAFILDFLVGLARPMAREKNIPGIRALGLYAVPEFDSIGPGHFNVQHSDVKTFLFHEIDGFGRGVGPFHPKSPQLEAFCNGGGKLDFIIDKQDIHGSDSFRFAR